MGVMIGTGAVAIASTDGLSELLQLDSWSWPHIEKGVLHVGIRRGVFLITEILRYSCDDEIPAAPLETVGLVRGHCFVAVLLFFSASLAFRVGFAMTKLMPSILFVLISLFSIFSTSIPARCWDWKVSFLKVRSTHKTPWAQRSRCACFDRL